MSVLLPLLEQSGVPVSEAYIYLYPIVPGMRPL